MPTPEELDAEADDAAQKGADRSDALHHAAEAQRDADQAAADAEEVGEDEDE